RQRVERNRSRAATAFPGARLVPFIGKKTFQRNEQKGTEAPLRLVRRAEIILFEALGEESLNEVFRIVGAVSQPANERVERIPIRLAELFQGVARPGRVTAPGGQHDAPVRRAKM